MKTPAEHIGAWLADLEPDALPRAVVDTVQRLLLDISGLIIAARNADYVKSVLAATESGTCTAFGHADGRDPYSAALVNGTGAHGEDFDDTFEGGPVHSGAVIVPAVLAACEREDLSGARLLVGIAAGVELLCRLSLVAPKAIHRAGFHPTAVLGAIAASGAVATALGLAPGSAIAAIGIAGSMASGIIEYLAEGTWTKRMHAGWAAQSGLRAALLARAGFTGPRTVLEGTHGLFRAFAPSVAPDFSRLVDELGREWVLPSLAFKPYACGTMTQPYVDCAIALAERGVSADDIVEIRCEVGEGTVHRLWEPLAEKQRPTTPYSGKFSTPYCMAVGFFDRAAGFAQFSEARLADPAVINLASRIRYVIDPDNEYPRNFTGHLRATLRDAQVIELRQNHMRGGARNPLSDREIEAKFFENALYGGWDRERAEQLRTWTYSVLSARDLGELHMFRG